MKNHEPTRPDGATPIGQLLFSRRQAAAMLSISEVSLWRLTARGELPSVVMGSRRLYAVDDLRAYIDRCRSRMSEPHEEHEAEEGKP